MLVKLDKFFVDELNKNGFKVDYKMLKNIYTKSRENPKCQARKLNKLREHEIIRRMDESSEE